MKPITAKLKFLKEVMADPDLSAPAKCVLTVLVLKHHDERTGRCNPGLSTIAEGVGRNRRNIIPVIDELKGSGWVKVVTTKGGSQYNSNKYRFDFSRFSTSDENDTPTSDENVTRGVMNSPHESSSSSSPTSGGRERGKASRRRAPVGAPPEVEQAFAEFSQLWQRGHPDDPAEVRRAFDAATAAHGVGPIMASARTWAASREPRYLSEPVRWLRGGWQAEPPRETSNSAGTIRRGGRKRTVGEVGGELYANARAKEGG